ncbi:MAG TPA: twin-arginine translocase subunit TatB [Rhodospirillales bacterium]|nr:twin-arginine translocase subunit TatB [Rhodospirillales bacterium]
MFDIGWSEMAIVLLVALIVIGPRDLPKVARTAGRWIGKARAMARDFQRSLEDMAREAELDEIKKGIEKVGSTDLKSSIAKTIDPEGELDRAFDFSDAEKGEKAPGRPAPTGGGGDASSAPGGEDEGGGVAGEPAGKSVSAMPASQPEKS